MSLISTLGGCHRRPGEQAEIGIGVLVDRSDPVDLQVIYAAELATAAVNDAGGLEVGGERHQVVLSVEDTKKNPEEASRAILKLINQENVIALVGPNTSRDALPASRLAENAHIPMISPGSTHPQTTAGKDYVFRVACMDRFQGRVLARFALDELRTPTAAVLYDIANDYNRNIAAVFRQAFEAGGGQVVALESYTTGDQDFSHQLVRIRDLRPRILFLPNFGVDIVAQVRQARQLGIDAILLGTDAWTLQGIAHHPEFEGAFLSAHWHPDTAAVNAEARAFIETYRRVHGQVPSGSAALGYDACGLLFQAIRRAGRADPERIRQALSRTENYRGVTGAITYRDTGGDPKKPVLVVQIRQGKPVLFKKVWPWPEV